MALAGCAGSGPLRGELRADVVRPDPGVVLFLCDGLDPASVEQGCRDGWLPNIRGRFVDGGTRVENAITVSPGITYAVITTLLTGVSPARHGVTGNRWFDPPRRLFRNYATIEHYRDVNDDFDVPTVYERIKPRFSASIQAAPMRGVDDNIANWAQSGVRWFFHNYTAVDALTAKTVELVAWRANRRGHWPDLLTCYFPGADSVCHEHGVSSPQYRRALVNLDGHVGRVCDWLESQGLLETTYLVLVSDHGAVDIRPDGYVDLMRLIRDQWGRNATDKMDQDNSFARRRRYFDRFDTAVAQQDGRKAMLYFAGPSGWDARPDPQEVEAILSAPRLEQQLWNRPFVDLVAYLADHHEAVLRSPRGAARIEERDGLEGLEYRYVPVPDDPLGYLNEPDLAAFVAEGFHDPRAWLAATCTREFPDVVPRMIPLMRNRRGGDVAICCAPGYSFQRERGGHGGIRRAEMRIPMTFAGPGITPGGRIECAHAVDLVPTLLVLLRCAVPDELEGVPLFPQLEPRAPVTMGIR